MDGVPETRFCNVEDIRRRRDVLSRIETSATRYIAFFFLWGMFCTLVFWFWISFLLGRLCSYEKEKKKRNSKLKGWMIVGQRINCIVPPDFVLRDDPNDETNQYATCDGIKEMRRKMKSSGSSNNNNN